MLLQLFSITAAKSSQNCHNENCLIAIIAIAVVLGILV
ncbi:hypothetical protein APA_3232 [Pseudanabaena sp. lw0831]|nr:hypothetical protein APA_3232 [Pseudanabaena sp. lw0831]